MSISSGLKFELQDVNQHLFSSRGKAGTEMLRKGHVSSFGPHSQKTMKIGTTLFDLLTALNEEVGVGEEELVAKIVYYWIESGRLKFISLIGNG